MIKELKERLQRRYWLLGFANYDERFVTGEQELIVRYMKGLPKDKWYADPFILDVTDNTIEVLVEELTYSIHRGRIARLSIEKTTLKLLSEIIILDLPTHLSFPNILREGDKVFIYPENSAARSNTLYQYDMSDDKLTKIAVLVDEPLTDAVIFSFQGQRYMFATCIPEDNSNHLLIFKEGEQHQFELFQEFFFDDKIARNAGGVLEVGQKMYKVSQDCSKGYGGGVIFHEIIFEDGRFDFKKVNEIYPFANQFALHTFNTYKEKLVIDVSKARYPIANSIISFILKIIH